jgi:hypothetical protein
MKGTRLAKFLKPNRWKVLLFVVFFLLVIGGYIQSWAFSDGFRPKSVLYDVLRPLSLWPLAVLLLAPLLLMSVPLMSLGIDLTSLDTWYGVSTVALYLYIVACGVNAALSCRP